ncbi:Uncharacterised protein r2_g1684 [Pycnogonum litorale]
MLLSPGGNGRHRGGTFSFPVDNDVLCYQQDICQSNNSGIHLQQRNDQPNSGGLPHSPLAVLSLSPGLGGQTPSFEYSQNSMVVSPQQQQHQLIHSRRASTPIGGYDLRDLSSRRAHHHQRDVQQMSPTLLNSHSHQNVESVNGGCYPAPVGHHYHQYAYGNTSSPTQQHHNNHFYHIHNGNYYHQQSASVILDDVPSRKSESPHRKRRRISSHQVVEISTPSPPVLPSHNNLNGVLSPWEYPPVNSNVVQSSNPDCIVSPNVGGGATRRSASQRRLSNSSAMTERILMSRNRRSPTIRRSARCRDRYQDIRPVFNPFSSPQSSIPPVTSNCNLSSESPFCWNPPPIFTNSQLQNISLFQQQQQQQQQHHHRHRFINDQVRRLNFIWHCSNMYLHDI